MISTDGSDLEECLIDNRSYYSTSSSVSTSMVVELTGMHEEWEAEDGSVLFQCILPRGSGTFTARERAFYRKLTDDINMVNTWYVAKLKECQEKVNLYEKQVDHFCELRKKNSSMSRGQTYRKLEFGLKELYRMNGYLKNYCMLNKQAIDKILKKHDKNSYFDSRGTVNNAVSHLSFFKQRDLAYQQQQIENLWREFIEDNPNKKMTDLKCIVNAQPVSSGFHVGLNTGMSIVLSIVLFMSIRLFPVPLSRIQMKSLWCFLRLQVFYCLQLWLWGIDVYVYQRYRINFEFIFGKYQPYLLHALDQFRIASRYTVFMLILVNVWYYCAFIAKTLTPRQIPFIAPISFVCLLGQIVPMPGERNKHRWYMLRHCVSILFVPFYTVRFPDFFLGDQFTSHTQTLYDMFHVIVSICTFSFDEYHDIYVQLPTRTITIIRLVTLILPNFIRLVQNLRRYRDTKLMYPNIYNGIKYLLSIISCSLFQYPKLFVIAQTIYTLYALYWDIREDWGLLENSNVHSKWFMLREKTLIPYPFIYHLFIFADILLRFAWVTRIRTQKRMDEDISYLLFGTLEVIRRGMWNIFRMENEQVNNCGKFRADLDVPIPFSDI
ncbi:hypothetical protein WA588_001257 [Blastocystis sp. NMH]